jgi:hypothetical protein
MNSPKEGFVVINPATGLPMIDGNIHGLDQAGYPFATGPTDSPDLTEDWLSQSTFDFDSTWDALD